MRPRVRSRLVALAAVAVLLLTIGAAPASAINGNKNFLVVLCNFTGNTVQPQTKAYYDQMYGAAGNGTLNATEFWSQISYGQFGITTTVIDWLTIPETRSQWAALGRNGNDNVWSECIEAADPQVDFTQFAAALAIFPEANTTLQTGINATQTAITVTGAGPNAGNFPTTFPFPATIDNGNGGTAEAVTVTGIAGNNWTITRAAGPGNIAHNAGDRIIAAGDLYGFGPSPVDLNGTVYNNLGGLILAHDIGLSVATHEMGHSFDMDHSRRLSTSTADYNDCWDLMSVITCTYAFTPAGTSTDVAYGGSSFGGTTKGPGLSAFELERNNWLPGGRTLNFITTAGCNQTTYLHAALNHPEVAGNLVAKIPATISVSIPVANPPPVFVTSDFYYLELRSKTAWDRGVPADAFVLSLRAGGVNYLVDAAGTTDGLSAGEFYADTGESRYFLVNEIRPATFDGYVTISNCKIVSQADYNGPTSADTTDSVALAGRLTVTSGFPIPNAPVTLSVGTQSCTTNTDADGDATCNVTITQAPGVVTAKIDYAGNAAVDATSSSDSFTITRETTSLVYNGDTTADYGDPFTASATLRDDDPSAVVGRSVTFTLGSQSCSGTTNGSGVASCSITINQTPGVLPIASAFAGDTSYEPSADSDSFEITRESAIVTYSGATTSDYHDEFTASATVVDDDPTPNPVVGKTITFTLGTLPTDTCSAITDATGFASCPITPNQPAGTVNLVSAFAGDTFYEPGSDTDAFVITHQETTTTYTGPNVILQGGAGVTLSAQLLEEGVIPPIPFGQTVTLGLGGQTCNGTVDAAGNASCTLVYTGPLGPQPLTATFAGDAYYEPSSDSGDTAIVFAFPARGAFTIGDTTAAAATPTTKVTYWNSQWSKSNVLSGGDAPSAAKGFASTIPLPTSTPPAACSGNWTAAPGASGDPAATVPSYMGVVVTSTVTKSGSTIAGDAVKIVVVKTDPGFTGNPGKAGTGVIVATYCG